jgi:anti-sigma B factor antagonist
VTVAHYRCVVLFEVTAAPRGDWWVVAVVGELDLATAPQLRQRLVGLISQGATRLAIDLRATDFIDSIGLGVIIGALKRLQPVGGELAVICSDHRIRTVFEMTRLDTIVPVHADVDEVVGIDG